MSELVVTTTEDQNDGSADNGLSLREAVAAANAASGADRITFAAGVGEAFVPGGMIRLTLGEVVVTDALTIDGTGAGDVVTLAGGGGRVLNIVGADATTTLRGLTISGGFTRDGGGGVRSEADLVVERSTIRDNFAYENGGGILALGSLEIADSVIEGNTSLLESGGGAAAATLLILRSTVSGNHVSSGGQGGGLMGGNVTVRDSMIIGNSTTDDGARGGGVAGATVVIERSTISGNSAVGEYAQGGGVFGGEVVIHASSITGNRAAGRSDGGGGVMAQSLLVTDSLVGDNVSDGAGAGVRSTRATITNSTLAGNESTDPSGRAPALFAVDAILRSVTIAGNYIDPYHENVSSLAAVIATNAEVTDSIIAGNARIFEYGALYPNGEINVGFRGEALPGIAAGALALRGGNVIGAVLSMDGVVVRSDVDHHDIFRDYEPYTEEWISDPSAHLPATADNGGPVATIALRTDPSNPVLDAGGDSAAGEPIFDGRGPGFDREVDLPSVGGAGAVDLGAYEVQADGFGGGEPVRIVAAASGAAGEGPSFTVFADGVQIGVGRIAAPAGSLREAAFEDFDFTAPFLPRTLDIAFADDGVASNGADVNLRIGAVSFGGQTYAPTEDGSYVRENGSDLGPQRSLYWNGTLSFEAPPKVVTHIAVAAAGTGDATAAPAFRVLADGVEIGRGAIAEPALHHRSAMGETFRFTAVSDAPLGEITVEFLNDGRTALGTDLNLIVAGVEIDGETFTADDATFIRAHDGADLGATGHAWWNGAVIFEV